MSLFSMYPKVHSDVSYLIRGDIKWAVFLISPEAPPALTRLDTDKTTADLLNQSFFYSVFSSVTVRQSLRRYILPADRPNSSLFGELIPPFYSHGTSGLRSCFNVSTV